MFPKTPAMSRRSWMCRATVGGGSIISASLGGGSTSGWLPSLSAATESLTRQGRHCVLLWMSGGPSQIDTFDMKPKHGNGGTIQEVSTSVPGIRFSEHLPRLAKQAGSMAILRGVSTKEGDHLRGATLMRTGFIAGSAVDYPAIGCSLSKALADNHPMQTDKTLPGYVTIAPSPLSRPSIRPGFLGPKHAATTVEAVGGNDPARGFAELKVDFLNRAAHLSEDRHQARMALWESMQSDFLRSRSTANVDAHNTVYHAAIDMMNSSVKDAFDLSAEADATRQRYGSGTFGQGCLMARRLIERGAPLVEVTLGSGVGWDTHADNFAQVANLSRQLDDGWASLMEDLDDRGLLQRTTILWAGEFGRTPVVNAAGGRDHFPQAFTCVLAGGNVAGGQTYGSTSDDGNEVTDGKIDQRDLLSTLCTALDVAPETENIAGGGRPIAIADGRVVNEVLQS
ncbi:hypothetical protein K227x_64780 [Rubripirellula lacrimiformis]|uniref:Sulfatase n=1 Tax=Rubripirellula lacrimiformis TaxID=1930273 RepID=A0A517NLP1_9BACT|nr:DUF1501 domain-containing protein [Rubripirellula lacrimiformis]QDT08048.1 hypothetical protein K227x_64780 [Rubripirellula lacrimiformis]